MVTGAVPRVLVAGIGNIFFGDDGFGVEVANRLARGQLPPGVTVTDFGIRGMHLAYELLETSYDRVIFVDTLSQCHEPGTLVVLTPLLDTAEPVADAHAMTPAAVLQLLEAIGGTPPEVVVVGCEPDSLDPGIGLSPAVAAAVEEAVRMVLNIAGWEAGAVSRGSPCLQFVR